MSIENIDLRLPVPFEGEGELRAEVRSFIADHATNWGPETRAHSWIGFDRAFSQALGEKGWIGMTWPRPFGHGRSQLERYVVVEELLAAGAPVAAHWIADRQSGPLILKRGTDAQKARLLPGIVRGDTTFCIGMSEPGSGSDLASLTSRARRTSGGWLLNGRKIWSTNAHRSEYMIALFRTGDGGAEDRHKGLTQFIVDMKNGGPEVRGITDLAGVQHFNELLFEDVFVPDDMLLGEPGDGWDQVVSELTYERSGPERYLSAYCLLPEALAQSGDDPAATRALGAAITEYSTLRAMSLAVANGMQNGRGIAIEAALVKELGTTLEQATPDFLRRMVPAPDRNLTAMLDYVTMVAPTFSIRGGTREILKGIVARGLGSR